MAPPLRTGALLLAVILSSVESFLPVISSSRQDLVPKTTATAVSANENEIPGRDGSETPHPLESVVRGAVAASALAVAAFGVVGSPCVALADEYGRETEAPTLFTGETVMICKKRGPLGACLETTTRTAENDNDKALKYFKDPSDAVREKYNTMTKSEADEGNELIQKLRQQSEDNREKNERIVKQKTLLNDQSASFGPFDRQVVILNEDGDGFTLLQNAQAMRLKEAGYIKDRKFVKQPSKEVIEQALEAPKESGLFNSLFGGGDDK